MDVITLDRLLDLDPLCASAPVRVCNIDVLLLINVYTDIEMVYRLTVTITEDNSLIYCFISDGVWIGPRKSHSFKISVTHPFPSIIYFQFPLHVIHLSCLGSDNSHAVYTSYLKHQKILFLFRSSPRR